ncbi:MAG TPA: hypothetical protein VG267_00335 [Terracidiphilus sp.]|jgi:hypothetical protein|nr:hypothetical protein [Terracidiphilus sp.]
MDSGSVRNPDDVAIQCVVLSAAKDLRLSLRTSGQRGLRSFRIAGDTLTTQTRIAPIHESADNMTETLSEELRQLGARLKDRVLKQLIFTMLVGACVSFGGFAQSTKARSQTKSTPRAAEITRFFIEEPKTGSGYETGPLHIVYDDGTEVVKTLPPLEASTEKEVVFNEVGFSGVQLAEDRHTLGWTIDFENYGTSYPIPRSLAVFRRKRVFHTFAPGPMVWSWMFIQGGEQIAAVFGPTHGPEVGDYRLYDVKAGKLMSEVFGDDHTQALKRNAPPWAKLLQDHLHNH